MRTLYPKLYVILIAILPAQAFGIGDEPVNYLKLTHDIAVSNLRAGNHDEEGTNVYFFVVEMHSLIFSKEESKKLLADRKKITVKIGEFGDFKVKSLDFWDKAVSPIEGVSIKGDQVRALVSQAMRKYNILETQVSVMVEVHMWERNKQFGLIGEDLKIGKAFYFAIPEKLPRRPNTKDLALEIIDEKGTLVRVSVTYEGNQKLARKK